MKILEKELEKREFTLKKERERNKHITLYLIDDRKQLLLELLELKFQLKLIRNKFFFNLILNLIGKNELSTDSQLIDKLKNQISNMSNEIETLNEIIKKLQEDKYKLENKVRL